MPPQNPQLLLLVVQWPPPAPEAPVCTTRLRVPASWTLRELCSAGRQVADKVRVWHGTGHSRELSDPEAPLSALGLADGDLVAVVLRSGPEAYGRALDSLLESLLHGPQSAVSAAVEEAAQLRRLFDLPAGEHHRACAERSIPGPDAKALGAGQIPPRWAYVEALRAVAGPAAGATAPARLLAVRVRLEESGEAPIDAAAHRWYAGRAGLAASQAESLWESSSGYSQALLSQLAELVQRLPSDADSYQFLRRLRDLDWPEEHALHLFREAGIPDPDARWLVAQASQPPAWNYARECTLKALFDAAARDRLAFWRSDVAARDTAITREQHDAYCRWYGSRGAGKVQAVPGWVEALWEGRTTREQSYRAACRWYGPTGIRAAGAVLYRIRNSGGSDAPIDRTLHDRICAECGFGNLTAELWAWRPLWRRLLKPVSATAVVGACLAGLWALDLPGKVTALFASLTSRWASGTPTAPDGPTPPLGSTGSLSTTGPVASPAPARATVPLVLQARDAVDYAVVETAGAGTSGLTGAFTRLAVGARKVLEVPAGAPLTLVWRTAADSDEHALRLEARRPRTLELPPDELLLGRFKTAEAALIDLRLLQQRGVLPGGLDRTVLRQVQPRSTSLARPFYTLCCGHAFDEDELAAFRRKLEASGESGRFLSLTGRISGQVARVGE